MFCPNCGANAPEGSANCPNCGTSFGNAAATTTPAVNAGTNMSGEKDQRNIALAIILSIVTCGIYALYWFVVLTDDTNRIAGESEATSGVIALLLTLVTCGIYGFYWAYKQGEKLDRAMAARGMESGNSGVLYLILTFIGLGIVAYALMQNDLNKMGA